MNRWPPKRIRENRMIGNWQQEILLTIHITDIAINIWKWWENSKHCRHPLGTRSSVQSTTITNGRTNNPVQCPIWRRKERTRTWKNQKLIKCWKWKYLNLPKRNGPPYSCFRQSEIAYLDLVDFRKLNTVTEQDFYSIPRMDGWTHSLGDT